MVEEKDRFLFEHLDVYQKALEFFEEIEKITNKLSRRDWILTDQLRRAALSISLNIAEGSGRNTTKDKKHFYYMVRGSVFECVPVLEILNKRN